MDQRSRRRGERIKQLVAELLTDMKDPRIGFVTVTEVRVSADVDHAQVFYTALPDDPDARARTADGLASAVPALQRELGRRLRTRSTPKLRFVEDPVPAHGRHIERLLDAAARGQEPGGEPELPVPDEAPPGGRRT